MVAMGHEDAFPRPRLSARCRFSQGTFARTRGNGRDAPKPDLCAAAGERASFELLPVIRLRRRDQQRSTHIPNGRSASSTDAFPRKVNGFLTLFAILCARKATRRALYGYTSSQDSGKDSTCGTQQPNPKDGQ